MGRHVAPRAASFGSQITAETRGRFFGRRAVLPPEPAETLEPLLSISQTMAILERIAERRTQYFGVSMGLVDRIQQLP
jgi:hypothetical protein